MLLNSCDVNIVVVVLLLLSCGVVLTWPLELFYCFFLKQRAFGNKLHLVVKFSVYNILKSGVEHTSVTTK